MRQGWGGVQLRGFLAGAVGIYFSVACVVDGMGGEVRGHLRWKNGDVLRGSWHGGDGAEVVWGSDWFRGPLRVSREGVDSVLIESDGDGVAAGEFWVRTASGDRWLADWVGVDGRGWVFTNAVMGEVRVGWGGLYGVKRRERSGVIFDGGDLPDWFGAELAPLRDLGQSLYREKLDWNGGGFPDLRGLQPAVRMGWRRGYVDLRQRQAEGRFAIVFEGWVEVEGGEYEWDLWANDKARLVVDGRGLLEYPALKRGQGNVGEKRVCELAAGYHLVRLEHLELGGGAAVELGLRRAGGERVSLVGSNAGADWGERADGRPATSVRDAVLSRGLELPEQYEVELELSSEGALDFVFAMTGNRRVAESADTVKLETWGGELVLVQGVKYRRVVGAEDLGRPLGLRLRCDRTAGRVRVFDMRGELRAELENVEFPPQGGVYLRNAGGDLRVDGLVIRRMGIDPVVGDWGEGGVWVRSVDGKRYRGEVGVASGGVEILGVDGGRSYLGMGEVDEVCLGVEAGVVVDEPEGVLMLSWPDGGWLRGRWVESGDSWLQVEPLFGGGVVRCGMSGGVLVRFGVWNGEGYLPGDELDRLMVEGGHLRGRLVDGEGGGGLRWTMDGVAGVQELVVGGEGRLERGRVMVGRRGGESLELYPHVLHLRSGDAFPCRVISMEEEGAVEFESFYSGRSEVSLDRVKSVELDRVYGAVGGGGEARRWRDFGRWDEGWLPLGLTGAGFERALTLPRFGGEGAITHLLMAKSGDSKRGRLLGMRGGVVQFESRGRRQGVPLERLERVVDVRLDEGLEKAARGGGMRVLLFDGWVLGFELVGMRGGQVEGVSEEYGRVVIPAGEIAAFEFGDGFGGAMRSRFAGWELRPAEMPYGSE